MQIEGDWMTSEQNATSWGVEVANAAQKASTYSIGLMGGSRFANDRRVVDRLLKSVTKELGELTGDTTLLVRLDAKLSSDAARLQHFQRNLNLAAQSVQTDEKNLSTESQATSVPVAPKSPLGPWYEISLPMPQDKSIPWALQRLPHWLPQWKLRHRLVAFDLGPMHLPPSRVIGRLCDACYLMLGPSTCASHEWIMQQIDFHSRSGTVLAGSVIATTSAAA